MKIAVIFCLFSLVHARYRGIIAFRASGLGANLGQGAGHGYNAKLGIGAGQGYGWQGPGYYGGYVGLGGYGANSAYSGPALPPVINPSVPVPPYAPGFPGNGVYGSATPLAIPGYGGYGYGGNGYGYGINW